MKRPAGSVILPLSRRRFMQSIAAATLAGCAVKSKGIGLITQSGPRSIPAGGGGGGAPFTAFYTGKFEGGTLNANATTEYSGFMNAAAAPIKYSNDYAGPFGENRVGKVFLPTTTGDNYYGGFLNTASAIPTTIGAEVWVRAYILFPTSMCNGGGSNIETANGAIKFWRARWDTNYRLTYMLGRQDQSDGSEFNIGTCQPTSTSPKQWMINSEVSSQNAYATSTPLLTRDTWHCMQWYIKCNTGTSGIVRSWVGTTPAVNNTAFGTRPTGGTAYDSFATGFLLPGDYFNGGPVSNGQILCYVANIIVATNASPPTTTDSNGNVYIDPTLDARNFV